MNVASRNPKLVCGCDLTAPVTCYKSIEMFRSFQYAHIKKPWRAFLTEKSHWIHMWPTCVPHVFPCGTHVLFQFHMFPHMWGTFSTCETHMRSCKHMCISCVSHATHMSPHVVICEAHDCGLLSISITLTCGKHVKLEQHTKSTCEFRVIFL